MATKRKLQKKKLTKKQIKEMQANVQSDMQDWTLGGGELNVGTATITGSPMDNDFEITYGQMEECYMPHHIDNNFYLVILIKKGYM